MGTHLKYADFIEMVSCLKVIMAFGLRRLFKFLIVLDRKNPVPNNCQAKGSLFLLVFSNCFCVEVEWGACVRV